jgi:hypothetical protein
VEPGEHPQHLRPLYPFLIGRKLLAHCRPQPLQQPQEVAAAVVVVTTGNSWMLGWRVSQWPTAAAGGTRGPLAPLQQLVPAVKTGPVLARPLNQ